MTCTTILRRRSGPTLLPDVAPAASGPEWVFRCRPFRIFMVGNLISWIGDWMDLAALNWAVLTLTGSAVQLGLINVCRLVPVFAMSLPAGVVADRMDRRRALIWLQGGTMMLTFLLAALVGMRCRFSILALVVAVRASLAAMVPPIRNALLPALVSRQCMPAAVASHTAGMNLAAHHRACHRWRPGHALADRGALLDQRRELHGRALDARGRAGRGIRPAVSC